MRTLAVTPSGSPPRVRGIVPGVAAQWADVGITPACAGNSTNPRIVLRMRKDHPRVCGE